MQCDPPLSLQNLNNNAIIAVDCTNVENDWCQNDIDYETIFNSPVLFANPHFFWWYERVHITYVAKILSIIYVVIYFAFCVLIYHAGISITVMFATLFTGSAALTTFYAVFKWNKLCLIPFFLLQTLIIINVGVLISFLFYAIFVTDESTSLGKVHNIFKDTPPFSPITWYVIIIHVLFLLELFFGYSIKLMFYEYEFIASVDKFLKTIKRSSSNPSKEGNDNLTSARSLQPIRIPS